MLQHAGLINSREKINPSEDWNLQKYSNGQQHKFNSIQAFHSFSKADCIAEKLGSELEIPRCPMVHDHWSSQGQWNSVPSTGLLDQQFSWEKKMASHFSASTLKRRAMTVWSGKPQNTKQAMTTQNKWFLIKSYMYSNDTHALGVTGPTLSLAYPSLLLLSFEDQWGSWQTSKICGNF